MTLADLYLYSDEQVRSLVYQLQIRPHIARISFCILHHTGLLSTRNAVFDPRHNTLTTTVEIPVPELTRASSVPSLEIAERTLSALFTHLQVTDSHRRH